MLKGNHISGITQTKINLTVVRFNFGMFKITHEPNSFYTQFDMIEIGRNRKGQEIIRKAKKVFTQLMNI